MTVCVAVGVYDGIVFATDTAVTVMRDDKPDVVSNVYQNGSKLFNFHRELPIMGMTSGLAAIDSTPIKALAKDFRSLVEQGVVIDVANYTVEQLAIAARKFFFEDHGAKAGLTAAHTLRFWIGGYGSDRKKHSIWTFTMRGQACEAPVVLLSDAGGMGVTWGTPGTGSHDPINRLLMGFCEDVEERMMRAGMDDKLIRSLLRGSEVGLWHPGMPIQDAIDLAKYLVELTKQYFRFLPGADVVGGDTDIAVVTKHEGFRWIQRKHFYAAGLNPPYAVNANAE